LQNLDDHTEDEVIDALCFFCDFVEHTSASADQDMVVQLLTKYLEIAESKHG